MDKTKVQKVNKALIATVFATSGIAAVVPPQTAAAATSPFKDINQYSSHYDNILKLYSQGAISGYPDNTFRPYQNVTRGQAAKMLATVLNLDLKNVQDPYFKDVPKSSEYYKYIAALQNAGIMSGYSNGTFMPNEVMTRGQLAKILALGFKFEVASNYNHSFKDVTSQTSNAIYIQTLVDLKITEGTTPVTFSPYNPVTRGQMSSFIVRSQEKKNNATSFKITGVEDDIVYINAEPYAVPESLSHIFNEDNAPVLKGALIEGNLSGKTIRSVSKLTLNASGTKSRFLEFDGNHGSFGATIVVNGNYIEFSNVTLTGTMLVNETVRPPLQLGYYQPISFGRIASTNTGFINWSNPDNPNSEGSSNNGSTTDLQDWADQNSDKNPDKNKPFENWSKDKVTMKNVEKHIEFYNSTVSRLVVSQSGTKIETNTKLPRVDIIGNVREFEIQGNIGTLNLDTETKLTIYGTGNIDWINYNSYTDLELYIDGRVGTLYVDNVYGWVDLGDYTYVDKVIMPKDESPNNIFDDFLEDKDNIGNIVDEDGKPVDKDDIDNQKPADKTKPLIDITNVTVLNGSDIQVDFTSDKVGTYYYIVREKDADAPTKKEMVNRISSDNVASGTGAAVNGKNTFKVTNLGEKKEYVVYVMVVDGAKNVSDIKSQSFQMKDATPPVVKDLKVNPLHGGKRAEFTFTASEPGDYYYYVRKKTTAADPTTADIVAKPTGKGKAVAGKLGITEMLTGLEAETEYQLYVVMKDASGNYSKDPAAVKEFKTKALDNINPYVEKTKLEPAGKENQFYIYLNEALDPESARNVNNYDLSGTVIVNTTGQKKIKPSAVEYKEGDKKVLLTIPSETGFVYGDTLRVTVLPGVKDLADNEFENANTVEPGKNARNFAEYVHEKLDMPVIKIENVISKPDQSDNYKRVEVEFKPNKAGTYYYMVLPDTVVDNNETKTFEQYLKDKGITERDFYNEFATESSLKSGYFQIGGQDIYIEIGSGPADLENDTKKFPVVIDKDKLNPFISYSVHMILKDRGGELSKITSKEIFGDSKAPLVTEIAVKSGTTKGYDDTKATVSFNTDETTKLHYWFVPKKNADGTDNPDAKLTINTAAERKTLEDKLKSSPSVTKSGKGASGTLDMPGIILTPHTEYVVYLGAQDTYGNFTVYMAKDGIHDESNAGWMRQDFYSDGTPPRFEMTVDKEKKRNIVYRNPDNTFTISFSEAIMRDEKGDSSIKDLSFLTITDETDQDITSQYQFVKYTQGTKTTDESQLIIKPTGSGTADKTFTVKMKDEARDFIFNDKGNKFDLADFGKYVYPGSINNRIDDAVVTGTNIGTDDVPASKTMRAIVYIDADLSFDQRYYYAVTGGATTIDPQLVIDLVKDPKTQNNTILAYGSDKLVAQSPANKQFTLNLTAPPAVDPKYTPVFTKNNNFFIFTVDQYGNIVWANDAKNPNNTYFKLGSNIKP
ncbi:S-layer homology domain-containing protein [Lysinibacillus sp. BPa_S21]|uniref:S-layer homology domain-containing protein n=1 Tax=Lysinibacillus sp. BPa_S21 TaxID=2932478 RepID=UPI002011D2F0|nr:S-layer homology domain-containing protein [Lysinibacillus sp. BPa_S21]MCL1698413.1 S-layer homology domain-containing protein [Lysinibacillus sp. BPa_S21]